MGWGGIIGSALAGAVEGGAQAAADDITMRQKDEMERLRQERLAELTLRNQKSMVDYSAQSALSQVGPLAAAKETAEAAAFPSQLERDKQKKTAELEAKAGEIRDIGGNVYKPGKNGAPGTWEVPPAKAAVLTQEQKDYYEAGTNERNAKAEESRAKAAAGPADKSKPVNEEFMNGPDSPNGAKVRVGKLSGVTIIEEPGKPAKPVKEASWLAKKVGLGEDVPAKAEELPRTRYIYDGKEITKDDYEKRLAETGGERKEAAKPVKPVTPPKTDRVSVLQNELATEQGLMVDPEEQKNPDRMRLHTNNIKQIQSEITKLGGVVAQTTAPASAQAAPVVQPNQFIDPVALASDAKSAIARGANAALVRARYKERTGKDLI